LDFEAPSKKQATATQAFAFLGASLTEQIVA